MSDYNLGTARGVIRLEFQDAGTKPAEDAIDKLGKSGSSVAGTVMGAVVKAVVAVGVAVGAAAGALAVSVVKTGVAYNTLEQTSRAAFKTILGSAEAAEAMMAKITEFGRTSPFPRQAFIEATQQMLGFGYAADDIVPILKTINDATAALGGNADTIAQFSNIFSKIKSNAKISGEEIARLGDIGIDAVTMLADAAGVTGEEMRKRISEGAVGAEEAIAALTEGMNARFAGAAENVKETWLGATDRIKGAWRDLSSALMEPFVSKEGGGAAVDFANSLADLLRSLIPVGEAIAEALGPKITSMIESITGKMKSFTDALNASTKPAETLDKMLKGVRGSITGVLTAIGLLAAKFGVFGAAATSGPIAALIVLGGLLASALMESEEFRGALGRMMGVLGKIAAAFAPVIDVLGRVIATIGEGLGNALAKVIDAALPSLLSITKAILPIIEAFAAVLEILAPIIEPLIEAALYPLIAVLELLAPILELIAIPLKWLGELLKEWTGSLKSAVGDGIESFSLLNEDGQTVVGELVGWIRDNLPQIIKFFQDVWSGIQEIWSGVEEFFEPIITWLIDRWNEFSESVIEDWENTQAAIQVFMDWWNESVYPILEDNANSLIDTFDTLASSISEQWEGMQLAIQIFLDWWNENVQPGLDTTAQAIGATFETLNQTTSTIWGAIQSFVGSVVDWFMTYVWPLIEAVVGFMNAAWGYAWSVISEVWTNINNKVNEVVSAVWNFIVDTWNGISAKVEEFFAPITDAIEGPVQDALDFLGGVQAEILRIFSGAADWLWNAGRDVINGFVKGLESMLGGVTDFFNNLTNMIPNEKGPPEKDRILLKPAGNMVMDSLIMGLMERKPDLVSALRSITTDIPLTVSQNIGLNGMIGEILPNGFFPDERDMSMDSLGSQYNFNGDILVPLEDLEQLTTLEEFFEMIRVYSRQGGVTR